MQYQNSEKLLDFLENQENEKIPNQIELILNDGNPQAISMLLWSYATLGYHNDDLFINLQTNYTDLRRKALNRVLNEGNSQSIANTLWSYATLGYRNDDLFINPDNFYPLEEALNKVLEKGNPQAITNTLWSYATLGYRYDDLFINPYNDELSKR